MYTGVKTDKFVKISVEFLPKETIIEEKKLLYEVSGCNDRCVKFLNDEDNIMDIAKIFHKCSKEKHFPNL